LHAEKHKSYDSLDKLKYTTVVLSKKLDEWFFWC